MTTATSLQSKSYYLPGYKRRTSQWLTDTGGSLPTGREQRILWANAICINQSDTKERNHQVGQMSSVYRQACEAIIWIWLGPETNLGKKTFRFLSEYRNLTTVNGRFEQRNEEDIVQVATDIRHIPWWKAFLTF
jgi:hypothetical protein